MEAYVGVLVGLVRFCFPVERLACSVHLGESLSVVFRLRYSVLNYVNLRSSYVAMSRSRNSCVARQTRDASAL